MTISGKRALPVCVCAEARGNIITSGETSKSRMDGIIGSLPHVILLAKSRRLTLGRYSPSAARLG
jgi:hypothetical protein